MCIGFVHKGKDIIYGYNFDLTDGAWDYDVYAEKNMFFIGIRFNGKLYRTHGVNGSGGFACLPYMNAPEYGAYRSGKEFKRIDLLVHDYIGGETDLDEIIDCIRSFEVVSIPSCSMHSLFGDCRGRTLLIEPGLGSREINEKYAVIGNYPIMAGREELRPELNEWYGLERAEKLREILSEAGDDLGLTESMEILKAVRQTSPAPTRVSFAYSVNRRTVMYARESDFDDIKQVILDEG